MLSSNEYEAIKLDYDRVSREYFKTHYVPPQDMSFAKSDALFPQKDLKASLSAEFETQCRILCFGTFPTWTQVQQRFEQIRALL
jgi:hypothetical protein